MKFILHYLPSEPNAVIIRLSRWRFWFTHVWLPAILIISTVWGLEWSGMDLWLSAHFYIPETNQWPYKTHWLTASILHKGGRLVFFVILGGILITLLHSLKAKSALKIYRYHLSYLFLASIAGPLLIMWLKKHTHIYCPWDLQLFGSLRPYIRWFSPVPQNAPIGHCFPAAHSGSGFTWFSIYFVLLALQVPYKYFGLYFALGLGSLYGMTQQLRGAHFLSHDIASLGVCWFMALLLFGVFFRKQLQWC